MSVGWSLRRVLDKVASLTRTLLNDGSRHATITGSNEHRLLLFLNIDLFESSVGVLTAMHLDWNKTLVLLWCLLLFLCSFQSPSEASSSPGGLDSEVDSG